MLRRSPELQDACGHVTRSRLSRSVWLRSLRCRLAAAARIPSLEPKQQAAATSSHSYQGRTAETLVPSATCDDTPRRRRSSRTPYALVDSVAAVVGNADLQHAGAIHAPQPQDAACFDGGAAVEAIAESGRSNIEVMTAAAGQETGEKVVKRDVAVQPGSAAAALKQRRLAAAAARQQQTTVSTPSVDYNELCSAPPEAQQCTLRHKGGHIKQYQRRMQQLTKRGARQSQPAVQQLGQEPQQQHDYDNQPQWCQQQNHSNLTDEQLSTIRMTRAIQKASRPQDLVRVLVMSADTLNPVHITAAAETLRSFARQLQHGENMSSQYKSQVMVAYRQLNQVVSSQLLDLDTRAVITLLHCFAKMGYYHQQLRNQQLLGDLLHISTNMMDDFSPQQLVMLVYAVAQGDSWVQTKPSRRWWMLFFEISQTHMSELTPQGFSNMVWALGKLERRPGAEWAAAFYKCTQLMLEMFTPQGLANVGSGLAHMHAVGGLPRPSQAWIDAFLASAQQQLEAFSSQGLANLLWALAKLGYCPPQDQLQLLMQASQSQLQYSSTQDLSLMVYSFAVLQVRLPESWWSRFWAASGNRMDEASSQALANTFYALGKLRRVPPTPWLLAFLPVMQHSLPLCSPQAAANVLWAAGRLRLTQLPGSWLDSLLARVYQMLHESKAVELGLVLQALKQLQHRPSDKWLGRFYAASQSKLSAFSPKMLAGVLEALAVLTPECPPPSGWSNAAMAQVSARLPVMKAVELAAVMWGMSELRMVPDKDFMIRFMGVAVENMPQMNGAVLARLLRTLVLLGQKPNHNWLSLLAEESYYHLDRMHPMPLADLVWGFGQLRYNPGPRWLGRVQQAAQEQLPSVGAKALVKLLQGLAGMQSRPGADWLAAAVLRVQQLLGEVTGQELLQCVGAFERLGLGPGTVLLQQLSAGSLTSHTAALKYSEAAVARAASATATRSGSKGQPAVLPLGSGGNHVIQLSAAASPAAATIDQSTSPQQLQPQPLQESTSQTLADVGDCDQKLSATVEAQGRHVMQGSPLPAADSAGACVQQETSQPDQLDHTHEVSAAAASSSDDVNNSLHTALSRSSQSTDSQQLEAVQNAADGDHKRQLVLLPKPQRPLRPLPVPSVQSPFVASR